GRGTLSGARAPRADPARPPGLFSDAEPGEDASEQILARELPGDLVQRLLPAAQLLGHELTGAPLRQLPRGFLRVLTGACQRLEVALAGAHRAGIDALVAHAVLQVRAQLGKPASVERGDQQAR